MIRGVHHVSITTPDRERLVAFYRDLLGFEVVYESAWDGGAATADAIYALKDTAVRMSMLRAANLYLEVFQFERPVGRPGDPDRPVCDAGVTHMCLCVDDVEAEYARLKAAGVRFHCPPQGRRGEGVGGATYGRDPDGNIFELIEPNPAGPFPFLAGA
jgi:catechol 2,3-dioxygenase-like lactoylglutathione lyase family enzyme